MLNVYEEYVIPVSSYDLSTHIAVNSPAYDWLFRLFIFSAHERCALKIELWNLSIPIIQSIGEKEIEITLARIQLTSIHTLVKRLFL